MGNRQAAVAAPCFHRHDNEMAEATIAASLGDEIPEGKSIVATHEARVRERPPAAARAGRFTIIRSPPEPMSGSPTATANCAKCAR